MAIVRCVLHGKYDWGDETRNVFHFGGDDAIVANGQTILDSLLDILMLTDTRFVEEYAFTGATFYDEAAPGVPGTFITPTGGDVAGTSTSDPLPGQVALLLNFWAVTVRPNRKRTYLAGQSEGGIIDGLWSSAVKTYWDAQLALLLDFDTESGIDARLGSYAELGASPGTPTLNYVTQSRMETIPATQRRRRRGTGI